ncbi:proteasome non-ATPase 26S subunit-domain-containing protein [Mycotypha africana]|uniref:proteasome non-ATPase 26S subunit-domain-containing protein n=1 Tax=Mycotypha africana TaxID=64632 RepID=UPI002300E29B|nr:proteasome non-ATPase 26S subunit-domain-containing protein [Mycotypha africana]KAI8979132.1 proteasome non-ATPase 26S subunit-domain-containing protein [Mycotypha africana]
MSSSEQPGALQQLSFALDPQRSASVSEKITFLRAFSATLQDRLTLEQSQHILQAFPLQNFYLLFSYEDDTLTTLVCDLLNKLLSPLTYEQIVSSENKQVYKCLESEKSTRQMVQSDVFPLILATIAFQDTKTANKASDFLYQLAKSSEMGQEAFFGPTCQTMLRQLLQITNDNGIISFRVYDLIIKVATLSDATFEQVKNSDLLTKFGRELETDDLLVQINAIELLNEVATTKAGVAFLEKAQLLPRIAQVLDNEEGDDDIAVQLAKCATVTVSTVGLIGSHVTGLRNLSHQSSLLRKCLCMYETAVGPLKTVLLQTLSKLLSVRDGTEDIESLTYQIYDQIPGRFPQLDGLVKEAKQPDNSIRIAAFAVMQAIACHIWGLKTWKFAIVQTMGSAPDALSIFGNSYYAQLQVYIRQGAHYKYIEPSAAVENS